MQPIRGSINGVSRKQPCGSRYGNTVPMRAPGNTMLIGRRFFGGIDYQKLNSPSGRFCFNPQLLAQRGE